MLSRWPFRRQLRLVASVAALAALLAALPGIGMFFGYDRIAGQVLREDLPEFAEWTATMRALAEVHHDFITLVADAGRMENQAIYRTGSQFPDRLADLSRRVDRIALLDPAQGEAEVAEHQAMQTEVARYRANALTAVDMLNYNQPLSAARTLEAGLAFTNLNQLLAGHFQTKHQSIDERLQAQLNHFELAALLTGGGLIVSFVLMLLLIARIARQLDGNFSLIRETLHRLGSGRLDIPLGSPGDRADGAGEMARIADDLHRFRDALAQRDLSRQLMDAIFRHILEAVVVIGRDGRIQQVNPVTDRMFGHAPGSLIGQPVDVLMPAPHAEAHAGYLARYAAGGTPRILGVVQSLEGRMADGRRFPIRLAVNEVQVAGETLFVGVIIDMSEIVAREAALRQARDEAQAASRAKSDFLANMSHEIRTPMNGIIGMADLALDAEAEDERIDYLRIVKSSAESLLVIINDILDFSKIEAGKLTIEAVDYDLPGTLQAALAPLRAQIALKGLAFTLEIDDMVPPLVNGDPTRLRQVLLNLVSNALKFTPQGSIRVRVDCEAGADGLFLAVAVHDTGIGIPVEKRESIFEAFSQADTSTTRQYGGTGLGLSITRRLVQLMGGELTLESTPGTGSCFRFRLPLQMAADDEAPEPASAADQRGDEAAADAEAADAAGGPALDVLLVEDNPINQQLALRLLEKWGHRPVLAANGADAVAQVAAGKHFDLVLMDMQMPVMGGIEATHRIRGLEAARGLRPLRIVAMTANAMEGDRETCLAAGMDDYLSKPIDKAQLAARLAAAAPGPTATVAPSAPSAPAAVA